MSTAIEPYQNEAYRKGDKVVLVHFRDKGEVYYHIMNLNEHYFTWAQCHRMSEADFATSIEREGAQRFDVNELPCAKDCLKCGEPIGEDGEWPVTVEGEIALGCYACFESECNESWWDAVQQLSAVGLLEEPCE